MLNRLYTRLPDRLQPLAEGFYNTLNYTDDELWSAIGDLLDIDSPVIVDGGAHEGETISKCLEMYSSPKIYAFEPNPNKIQALQTKHHSNDNIRIIGKALGKSEGTVKMNLVSESDMSSIFEPTTEYLTMMGNDIFVEESVEVKKVTLDEEISNNIDVLKLDLQGYEYNALNGASEHLHTTPIVTSEVMFKHQYKRQPLFCEVNNLLNNHGFSLFNLFNLKHNPNGVLRHAPSTVC